MVGLVKAGRRFDVNFTLLAGGSGVISGTLAEPDQNEISVSSFIKPRQVLRTFPDMPVTPGMVLKSPAGTIYIVGKNGPSEMAQGTIFNSWRLFEATGRYAWERRKKRRDPVTQLERDDGLQDLGTVWAAVEPLNSEASDRKINADFEQFRFITAEKVLSDDHLDNRKVTKSDLTLGVRVGMLM